ncbi:MAG TPA: DapH/DapD/GlmU-related protein [Acidobacteriota bacterium]|nr:DapH/DapD/GlmU-related protein [Acidobacteriota bacterium]
MDHKAESLSSVGRPYTDFQSQLTTTAKSPLTKYMDMQIGMRSWWALFKYEFVMMLCNARSGALGYLLRKLFYPMVFGSIGRNVTFGRNITIRHPHKIKIGDNCIVDENCVLDAKGDDARGIELGNNCVLSRNNILSCKGGYIKLGDGTNIAQNSLVHSEVAVEMGKNTLVASYVYFVGGGNHDFSRTDVPVIQQPSLSRGGIFIEDNCWFGAGVIVLDGSKIGRDCVIGAGAIVNSDLPAYSLAVGTPARVLRNRLEAQTDDTERHN